eukprot:CAMPEP_0198303672 /NCGR_PEP_ID=MMETSP1449-20131203/57006_1 /TAXON_ID=420275 /ORGANISM="Attheya septentrionalis, Strain CCMP2084" /LENGTH=1588 /DNA_ID=CAMNT_0044006173 /DNA_START=458 /DNA_END=5224 /DNA_ORIENTATION=-
MERSMHNDSTHGKTSAQIIKDLRASNAALSRKMAEMESEFMNQLNSLSRTMQAEVESKDKAFKRKTREMEALQKEMIASKDETSFQRAIVLDLKNQVDQLEQEADDAEDAKQDEAETWQVEKKELQATIEFLESSTSNESAQTDVSDELVKARQETKRLTGEVVQRTMDLTKARSDNEELRIKLENAQTPCSPDAANRDSVQVWKKLDEKQKEVETLQFQLDENTATVAKLTEKNETLVRKHSAQVSAYEQKLQMAQNKLEASQKTETELRTDVTLVRKHSAQVSAYEQKLQMAQNKLEASQKTETELRTDVESLRQEVDTRDKTIETAKGEAENREMRLNVLRDTLESMRKTNISRITEFEGEKSSLEKRIESMETEIESLRDEVAQKDQDIEEVEMRAEQLKSDMDTVQQSGKSFQEKEAANFEIISNLKEQLEDTMASKVDVEARLKETQELAEGYNIFADEAERKLMEAEATIRKLREASKTEMNDHVEKAENANMELKAVIQKMEEHHRELRITIEKLEHSNHDLKRDLGERRLVETDRSLVVQESEERVQILAERLKEMESQVVEYDEVRRELEDAHLALAAMDDEKNDSLALSMEIEHVDLQLGKAMVEIQKREAKIEELTTQLTSQEKIVKNVGRELQSIREKLTDEVEEYREEIDRLNAEADTKNDDIEELEDEIKNLRDELNEMRLQLAAFKSVNSVNRNTTKGVESIKNCNSQDADEIKSLSHQIVSLQMEKDELENDLNDKLDDRETTISALVKSSVTQEQKLAMAQSELKIAKQKLRQLKNLGPGEPESKSGNDENDFEGLRQALEESKNTEDRLTKTVADLEEKAESAEKQLAHLDAQLQTSRAASQSPSAFTSSPVSFNMDIEQELQDQIKAKEEELRFVSEEYQTKLDERDQAITTLVKANLKQESQMSSLKARSPDQREIEKLRKETEIFAGQVIEQDEEIEELRATIKARETRNMSLVRDLAVLRRKVGSIENDANKVANLELHIEQLQEANVKQRDELVDLRRKVRDSRGDADRVLDLTSELEDTKKKLLYASEKVQSLQKKPSRFERDEMFEEDVRKDLSEAIASRDALEQQYSKQIETIRRVNQNTVDSLLLKIKERDTKMLELEEELSTQKNTIRKILAEVETLKAENDQLIRNNASNPQDTVADLQAENEELRGDMEKNEALADEFKDYIMELKRILDDKSLDDSVLVVRGQTSGESLVEKVRRLKEELNATKQHGDNDNGQTESERFIIANYERKLSLLKLNKDVSIDGLRKELAQAKGKSAGGSEEFMQKMRTLSSENERLKDELQTKLSMKNDKIMALEQTIGAQQQVVDHMRSEMDHLQSGMERTTQTRRAELEDMQQEVMDKSAKLAKQEREITAFKMEREEIRLRHQDEIEKLKKSIESLERDTPMQRDVKNQLTSQINDEFKDKLEKLKWRNATLQEENNKLRERLEKAEAEGKSSKNDKWRQSALQEKVVSLSHRCKELETEIETISDAGQSAYSLPATFKQTLEPPRSPRASLAASQARERHAASSSSMPSMPPISPNKLPARSVPSSPLRSRFAFRGKKSSSDDMSSKSSRSAQD